MAGGNKHVHNMLKGAFALSTIQGHKGTQGGSFLLPPMKDSAYWSVKDHTGKLTNGKMQSSGLQHDGTSTLYKADRHEYRLLKVQCTNSMTDIMYKALS